MTELVFSATGDPTKSPPSRDSEPSVPRILPPDGPSPRHRWPIRLLKGPSTDEALLRAQLDLAEYADWADAKDASLEAIDVLVARQLPCAVLYT